MEKILKREKIDSLITGLKDQGYKTIAPKKNNNLILLDEVQSADEISLDHVITNNSIKEYFLPKTEKILSYRIDKNKVNIEEPEGFAIKTAIFGSRPCDAASLPVMDKVFNWDCSDKFWVQRREATAIMTIACDKRDAYCFCTSVGLAPDAKQGSDVLLTKVSDNEYLVETITEKGEDLIKGLETILSNTGNPSTETLDRQVATVEKKFDIEKVKPWLDKNFVHKVWAEFSMKCISCGACTFVCPTCHCFDIVDECTMSKGDRVKNWDGCQFKMFTVHTSGHNPRSTKDQRWRQRIMHKFKYYVEMFDNILCVGCGRCSRVCPADMNISEMLEIIASENS
ncbi:MAG: 4Fe-4S ferredoxin iron-sulfur binding protein [Candidatus Scalindua rubra]|uniref:4Fe-4S ferredoxin iron-sulfur binding protein n=1 Tax=Candidatus Scalindua rubra TaxID=1872076 RepID=A0A1E3XER5_9BACT|nr:MAG: 4Fe-4S ferredoxin iron-sulfur binding protein [Candidatus Scalindua rubra]